MKRLLLMLLASMAHVYGMGVCNCPSVGQLIAEARAMPIDMYEFVSQKLDDGYSLLHAAAHDHDVKTAAYLIEMGLNVNDSYTANQQKPKTALMVAIERALKYKKFETLVPMLELLCKNGAVPSREYCTQFDIHCKSMDVYTNGHIQKCRAILAAQLNK